MHRHDVYRSKVKVKKLRELFIYKLGFALISFSGIAYR